MTPRTIRKVWTLAVVVAAMAVFSLYTRPDFMVQMANQLWSCF